MYYVEDIEDVSKHYKNITSADTSIDPFQNSPFQLIFSYSND